MMTKRFFLFLIFSTFLHLFLIFSDSLFSLSLSQISSVSELHIVERKAGEAFHETSFHPPQKSSKKESQQEPFQKEGLLGTLDQVVKGNPKPPYPLLARRLGLQGEAFLSIRVTSSGTVSEISLNKSTGHPILDEALLETVKKWRIPHTSKKEFWLTLPPFSFTLEKDSKTEGMSSAR